MKLAAIYNVFDGEELLEQSIKSIKDNVDIIIIVFQTISNFGEVRQNLVDKIIKLKTSGLVNELILFTPKQISPQLNEQNKRRIGLIKARELGATHFLTMDCDEFYYDEEFKNAKNICEKYNIDASIVFIQNYWKKPEFKCVEYIEPFKCGFINKIYPTTDFETIEPYFTDWIDPTRRINTTTRNLIFSPNFIMMHHYTTIRSDITRKYNNSTARLCNNNIEAINDKIKNVKDYNINDLNNNIICVKKINNFNIKI